jgi:hypothetical protein
MSQRAASSLRQLALSVNRSTLGVQLWVRASYINASVPPTAGISNLHYEGRALAISLANGDNQVRSIKEDGPGFCFFVHPSFFSFFFFLSCLLWWDSRRLRRWPIWRPSLALIS